MSHRGRAAAFLALAVAAAVAAAAAANGYRASVAGQYGELRPVLVAAQTLGKGEVIGRREARRLSVRRIPGRFIPPGALARAEDALGRTPQAPIPAGSYVLDAQLVVPGRRRGPAPGLEAGLRPVEISVGGGGALASLGSAEGRRVDVVVTTESNTGSGNTYVAAANVKVLALEQGGGLGQGDEGAPGEWLATLAVTRQQAIRLIDAESFARSVRLLPRLAGD